MFKRILAQASKVISLNSSAFSEYFQLLMTIQNINSVRNGNKVLMFYFCCEIISSHMAERSIVFKPIVALVAFCIFAFIYVITIRVEKPSTMISVASIMVVLCMSYSIILSTDKDEMMEARYSLIVAVIMMMYTLFHLRFLITMLLSIIYIVIFIGAVNKRLDHGRNENHTLETKMHDLEYVRKSTHGIEKKIYIILGQCVLFFLVYLTGLYLRLFNSIRRKSAFLKLAQNAHAKIKMNSAVKVQLYWIEAIMPSAVKSEFLKSINNMDPFNLIYCQQFEDVSILFGDIVGFTAMSSNKTAKQLVYLLNDLYNRFDDFGKIMNCEKIATLGDCYYCVSGCPVPRVDHAVCCVEMGLGMCKMILRFNVMHRESINMRIGVHSGRVIAAILGNCRFRFDVYSNDVVIANALESSGIPGRVHISENTYALVRHAYKFEDGENLIVKKEEIFGLSGFLQRSVPMTTYFVVSELNEFDEFFNKNVSNRARRQKGEMSKAMKKDEFKRKDDKMKRDLELIRSLQRDPEKPVEFFQNPPINGVTLTFTDEEIESHYQFHTIDQVKGITIDSTKLALLIDAVACQVFSTVLLLAAYLMIIKNVGFSMNTTLLYLSGIATTVVAAWISLVYKREIRHGYMKKSFIILNHPLSRLSISVYVSSLPSILVLTFYDREILYADYAYTVTYFTLTFFALISSCLFSASYSVIKQISTAMCTATAIYSLFKPLPSEAILIGDFVGCSNYLVTTLKIESQKLQYFYAFQLLQICLLIYYLTRENERNMRIFFYASREAEIKNDEAKRQKKVAEKLLYNIIPKYVFTQIAGNDSDDDGGKFSYAHAIPNAGVVFACISNFFSSYYREDYRGGITALKVLHNIICGFDNILKKPIYSELEKIKTINDCYMMASGLNTSSKTYNDDHLIKLLYFTFEMRKYLKKYNREHIIGTSVFYMKIGYNFGPVTAGIIGTSKPLYDIWGDAVNVASRMYSTAPAGKIQVSSTVMNQMKDYFKFEYRGEVFLKGKGDVVTYLALKPFEKLGIYETKSAESKDYDMKIHQ